MASWSGFLFFNMMSIEAVSLWITPVLALLILLYGAWRDIRTHELPDELSLALIALWMVDGLVMLQTGQWNGVHALWSFLLALAVFGFGFVLFLAHGVGGGDVKIMSAFALWIGVEGAILFIGVTLIAGGIMSLLVLARALYYRGWSQVLKERRAMQFAYAPAIFVGGATGIGSRWSGFVQ